MKAVLLRLAVALVCLAGSAPAWTVARTEHFEVYSQAGRETAVSTAARFEQLRAFLLQQTGLGIEGRAPVRVVVFASEKEYAPYRLGPAADAFCVSTDAQDYIVMTRDARVAAHEYAHAVLHSKRLKLPEWLAEGLAEVLASVRMSERGSSAGGDLPERLQTLLRREWLPLPKLLAITEAPQDRDEAEIFYAESWALTSMLMFSPKYSSRFREYAEHPPVDAERDLRIWVNRPKPVVLLAGVPSGKTASVSEAPDMRQLLAEVLMVSGRLELAEQRYRELLAEHPDAPNLHAAMGTLAFRKGDRETARTEWKQAIALGVTDANLCFQYAAVASSAGLPADEIRPALERAIALRPDFDEAHYSLAILEKNAGRDEIAVEHFRKMITVGPARAYYYWSSMADSLLALDRREEALDAAEKARKAATDAEQRIHTLQLARLAQTDLAVQFTKDASGRQIMATTRAPHGATDWNPFIEPDDVIRRDAGTLRSVECGEVTRLTVETAAGPLALAIPDLSRLAVRNGSAELTCGPQQGSPVTVVYAARGSGAAGVLRGIEFQ